MKPTLRTPLLAILAGLALCACQKIDLTQGSDDTEETSGDAAASPTDSAATDGNATDGVDGDYISDTADYRGYGTLEVYLNHYGTDSLHCIPLVDLLEGGWVREAFEAGTENQEALWDSERWVGAAYIVGYASGSTLSANTAHFTADGAGQSNVLIALTADETDCAACVPVQLSSSSKAMQAVRDACNLGDNPGALGMRVKFLGKISTYFATLGLKSVTQHTFTSDTVLLDNPTDPGDTDTEDDTTTDQDTTDDATGEDDADQDTTDDTDEDGEDTNEDSADTNDFNGYHSIDEYMAQYGWTYDNPIPLADCVAGGCLHDYYTTEIDPDEDLHEYYSGVWVGDGYIVGYCNSSIANCVFSASGAPRTNILLAADPACTDPNQCLPVNLLTGTSYEDVRNAYNLADNPDSLGARIVVCGSLDIKYGTLAVIKTKAAVSLPREDQTDGTTDDTGDTEHHKWARRKK